MKESTIKVSHAMQGLAQGIAEVLDDIAGERVAFALIVYTEGRASYVSNATREESVRELKLLLEHWENGTPDIPAHKYNA